MKKLIVATVMLAIFSSASAVAADQVSKEEISHFKLIKVGTINVSQSGGEISSPSDLSAKLSALADEKGGRYYHIIAAREHGPNFEAVADVYKEPK
ncbi:DUF1471 domain-containing protein [Salmonella enterica]|uniref:DUF1471 domain-containing protein n=1 Tax=Salmonella enterica TaxID=28901 RepID=UPI0009AC70F5|nr:DUF1471 domain-containing protein [Salmonella enterica]EDN4033331.1 DUF1471 domain-containing protein [Salmonella enterica subsp. enterica serovar Ealing]EAT4894015.1 DUF1471 domain-containing protein [Salmonella enterica]EBD8872920.1 DUF1471 domain-containing protein [Salmonella enterica]EBK9261489.1 DUF1471 domain-containing protein [Salmonella enterica]EBL9103295.1 DUF1471 domain-containing protein [Salmonella enterica]